METLTCASIYILAAILAFHGSEGVPSPLHSHHYGIDMGLGEHPSGLHHRAPRRTGRGSSFDTWACGTISTVPNDIRTDFPLDAFYQKYTHAYGIPIVSSNRSQDAALTRACYMVRFLLADRQDIRDAMYDQYGRVAVIAQTEETTDIPEHSHLGSVWNDRARGLGGTRNIPVTTDGEENILCKSYLEDRWYEEDVLLHEFAHAIHLISLNRINASFQPALKNIYNMAKADNLWSNTYAISNFKEYFAEGVQGFFNVQTCRSFVDNVHNDICTRDALRTYDRRLYDFIEQVFPCVNDVVDRCDSDQSLAANQALRMNCDVLSETTTDSATDASTAQNSATSAVTVTPRATDTVTVTPRATDSATVTPKATDSVIVTPKTTDSEAVTPKTTDSVTVMPEAPISHAATSSVTSAASVTDTDSTTVRGPVTHSVTGSVTDGRITNGVTKIHTRRATESVTATTKSGADCARSGWERTVTSMLIFSYLMRSA